MADPGFLPAVVCVGLVLFYYLSAWWLVGRDPSQGSVVPQYESPGELSPPALRYLRRAGFDHKALVSAVLDIAAHGCARISAEYGRFVVTRSASTFDALPREEQAFAGRLLKDEFIDFSEENGEHIRSCAKTLDDSIRKEVERRFLRTNGEYVVVGAAISAFAAMQVLRMAPGGQQILHWVLIVLAIGGAAMLANATNKRGEQHQRRQPPKTAHVLFAIAVFTISTMSWVSIQRASWALAAIAALVAINLLFQWLLKAPTAAGRQLMDQVEGFREFLRAVELDRFRTLHPGETIPETIDHFFPYAYALDLEHEWNERFGAAVHESIRIRGGRRGAEGLDIADALSVVASVVLGSGASSVRAR